MSGPRKYFGGRVITNRPAYDRINPKFVPPSRHAIFIRGFPSDIDNHKIRDFFQDASKSSCGIDFTSYNDELRKLSIALRFESHEIAQEMLSRFNNTEIFGHRVDVTWFKDLKKARDRMIDDRRVPYDDNRMNYNKTNRFEYDRRDNRDWSDNRRRFPPNNNNRSKSLEKGEATSERSYGNRKQSTEYERSPTKSTIHSDDSNSEIHERRSPSLKRSQISSTDKPSAYRVDLDESIEMDMSLKPINKSERSLVHVDSIPDEGLCKPDSDEKKKKKKKRKRRHMDHSGSQDSFPEPMKMMKYNDSVEKAELTQYPAIAGDLSNWNQLASDSDDYLNRNNQISKVKPHQTLTKPDRINNDRQLKMLRLKLDSIEKAYKKDSETYSSVINVLIRKAPELKTKLESLMKEILVDASNQSVDSMRDYILHLSDTTDTANNSNTNNVEGSLSPSSSL